MLLKGELCMKRILCLCLLACLLVCGVPFGANAEEAKAGYTLTPVSYRANGIATDSTFILTTPDETTPEAVADMLSIDGEPAPTVIQEEERRFRIQPAAPFHGNTLYFFRVSQEGQDDVTWAFQTETSFQITSTLPSDQAVGVPVDSGIEITFSNVGYSPLDNHFSISPAVAGRFEYHDETAVFVPEGLAYDTVYTVTLKAGITLPETGETLDEDYTFAFKTVAEPDAAKVEEPAAYFSLTSDYAEANSLMPASINIYTYFSDSELKNPAVDIQAHRFSDAETAISLIQMWRKVPTWAFRSKELIDPSGMEQVMQFQTAVLDTDWQHEITFPDTLDSGFYLITVTLEGQQQQMIVQVSDLPVQVVSDKAQTLVWVNDSTTGRGAAGATVYDPLTGKVCGTDENGLAILDRALEVSQRFERLDIIAEDGKQMIWMQPESWYGYDYAYHTVEQSFWSVLRLDRTLFQADDTVPYWGFVRPRSAEDTLPDAVTVTLTQGYGSGVYGSRDVLVKETVTVDENGIYTGALRLPVLEEGGYYLQAYVGDLLLDAVAITIDDYVKPQYQMQVTTDKKAFFAEEPITFTIQASFFEGTPVSALPVTIHSYGYNLIPRGADSGVTDAEGKLEIVYRFHPTEDAQGYSDVSFSAEATLPEAGEISAQAGPRVFINDIDMDVSSKRQGKNASMTVDVNTITLDRLNNGTAENSSDYLDQPVTGKQIDVQVVRQYYEKIKSGERYDFIEKKNVPLYAYESKEEILESFTVSTDQSGHAEKAFQVPDREGESYFLRLTCQDESGRRIEKKVYVGQGYPDPWMISSESYALEGEKEAYQIGDEVSLQIKRGVEEIQNGNFLFVKMRDGIRDYAAGQDTYRFTFAEEDVPNIWVKAYYFDGQGYASGSLLQECLELDTADKKLNLEIQFDKESYRPGDTCTVTVTATDQAGVPKETNLNLSVVDEALFSLKDYSSDTLLHLYRLLYAGRYYEAATHNSAGYIIAGESAGGGGAYGPMSSSPPRSNFQDTAAFASLRTDANGKGSYTFTLPDNITTWRLTAAGVSDDLCAGDTTVQIPVTKPCFINYTLNDTFLIGDIPVVGVNAYGTGLRGSDRVRFTVWDQAAPDQAYTAEGNAFERINIPLWEMNTAGTHSLVIQAETDSGLSDAVVHTYRVLETYREMETAQYYDVTTGTEFAAGEDGMTEITFTDRGRGKYLYLLRSLLYPYGDRVEKLTAEREAARLIQAYFPELELHYDEAQFDPSLYQRAGGMGILPYADVDLELTVKLMPYVKDEIDRIALKDYLYRCFEGDNAANKLCALYGLAQLHEPVLIALDRYAALDTLSVEDTVYLALGYLALGEAEKASQIYDARIAPMLEQQTPYYRVNTGTDSDDILKATSAALSLAAQLDKPEQEGMYQYCMDNNTEDILVHLEKLTYASYALQKAESAQARITYQLFDETYSRELGNGGSYTLRIPSQNIDKLKLLEVTGDVGAVAVYNVPMTSIGSTDPNITVRRQYYKGNTNEPCTEFNQGDLVRVQLWIDYSQKALQGSYQVTDYLPAGLAYVADSAKIEDEASYGYGYQRYCTVEGQKVTFYDYNRLFDQGYLYYYYARVVNPGSFQAEGLLVQNLYAKDAFTIGESNRITITVN